MRIAVAEIAQETDSFSPLTSDLKDFESTGLYFGHEILERIILTRVSGTVAAGCVTDWRWAGSGSIIGMVLLAAFLPQNCTSMPSSSCDMIRQQMLCARILHSTSFFMATSVLLRTSSRNFALTMLKTLST